MRRITSVWDLAPPDLPEPVIPTLGDWLAPMADMSADDLTEQALSDSVSRRYHAVQRGSYSSVFAKNTLLPLRKITSGAHRSSAADRLASARPKKRPAPATNRRADPALIQRLGQGTRECDGQERAGRLTVSLMGTWSALHRSGTQTEKATFPGHPAAAMTSRSA